MYFIYFFSFRPFLPLPLIASLIRTSHSHHYIYIPNSYLPDQVKQYQKIHGLRKAIATSKKGNSLPSDYFLEFSCGRGGNADENKRSFLSSSDLEPNQDFNEKKFSQPGSEMQNLDEKLSRNSSNVALPKLVVNETNTVLCERTEVVDDVRDIKVEVENILEHSSGASLLERMLQNHQMTSSYENEEGEKGSGEETEFEKEIKKELDKIENEDEMKKSDEEWEKKFDHDFNEVASNANKHSPLPKTDTIISEIPSKSIISTAINTTTDTKISADKVMNEELESELSSSYLASAKDIALLRASKYHKKLLEEKQKNSSFF